MKSKLIWLSLTITTVGLLVFITTNFFLESYVACGCGCCGGIEPLLNDFIEAGLDSINPVQISCEGMNPKSLKQTYGDRFTFWGGGCDTRYMLPHAKPNEIREHVRDLLSIWTPGGGFVFQQVHNIMADVTPENIIAMFEAVRKYN